MIARSRLHALVDAFPGRRVLVYGDAVLDRFILGTPKRISREAPVIILRHEGQRDVPGGGANAMANVASLGGAVLPVTVVGDDEPGAALRAALQRAAVDTGPLLTVPGLRTVTKVRLLGGGASSLKHQVARYDIEDELAEDAGCRASLLARLESAAAACEAAMVSDYGYGVVDPGGVRLLRSALRPDVPLIADSRFALASLVGVHGAAPNLEELQAAAGAPVKEDEEVAAAAESLRRRLQASFLVATRGSRGLTLVEEGHTPVHLPVYGTDQVADVTGAGDTVIAALTLALAAGASAVEAAALADLAGGIVVMKLGTATVAPDELHRAIDIARFLHD